MPHSSRLLTLIVGIAFACSPPLLAAEPMPAAETKSAPAPAASDDSGMLAFNNHCRQCHSYKDGDNRLGPYLHGVVGRKAGTAKGYGNYSPALKDSDITWTPELLDQWITNPEKVVSGNNMQPFPGVADAGKRQMIINFLKSQSSVGQKSSSAAD